MFASQSTNLVFQALKFAKNNNVCTHNIVPETFAIGALCVLPFRQGIVTGTAVQRSPRPALIEHDDTMGNILRGQLEDIRAAGTFKHERVILTPQEPVIRTKPNTFLHVHVNGTRQSESFHESQT